MARTTTVARVHAAVLELATAYGPASLTMEGIAAKAGVGKQTLYRTWQSVPAILFDALLTRSTQQPDTDARDDGGDLQHQLEELLRSAIEEITTQPHESLLRTLAATIQTDEAVAREFQERLLRPQLSTVQALFQRGGVSDTQRAAELLLGPVFYRWFMRLPTMSPAELTQHVSQVLRCAI
ncbi:TetR/AcrR family transcriptional regulator [Rhodococcus sp. NPDC049939]|uniref:TetR/AcrR family transcriptional regulator n=1 Tax=Rhodococcus sp. NPDC049939 TaxID=3155511 RepID=UPI0033E054DD